MAAAARARSQPATSGAPNPGHLVLAAGLPVVLHGLVTVPVLRHRRPFSSVLLLLDCLMMACAWL